MTSEAPTPTVTTTADVEVSDQDLLLRLTGPGEAHLRLLEKELSVSMGLRGDTIRIQGDSENVAVVERVLAELVDVMSRNKKLTGQEIARAARTAAAHPEVRLRELFDDVVLTTASKRVISPKGFSQQVYVTAIRKNDIVFGIGPAGTGKTYLAMAMAVAALQRNEVKRILLTRPAVEAGEKLGFLPGDLAEKVNPYLRPLYDALHDMMSDDRASILLEKGTIEVAPLAFMRGRTLNDAFVILDEAQNTTTEQMKMFLTRLGFRSRAVITGDITQVDLPGGKKSGLADAEQLLGDIEGIRFCRFTDQDVVRHPLVQKIVRAYDERDARRQAARMARDDFDND
ncbi:MAG: phosphate starvation-inducible protein PhoH [Sandaracinus sp.]|nr:phosphate starvation-inducible protein PhoH [Sandaracinus sp.]|tara:strand:- start:23 stop:1048 length:1026 start_codon:yes stop_codon:yes gene_type:complete